MLSRMEKPSPHSSSIQSFIQARSVASDHTEASPGPDTVLPKDEESQIDVISSPVAFAPEPTFDLTRRRTTRSSLGNRLVRHESIRDAESLATIDRPPSQLDGLPASKVYHPLSFPVLALLAPASVFGVLARLGLMSLFSYEGEAVFPLIYAQLVGCFIMGFGLELKEPFGKFYGPLYTAWTTGFCGSLTSFSSWQVDVFTSWLNVEGFRRHHLDNALDGITKTVVTFGMSLFAVTLGARLAVQVRRLVPPLPPPPFVVRHGISVLSVLIYAATIPAYLLLPRSYRHQATAAMLFSYPGTLTRYALSLTFNPAIQLFPLGTFVANIFGTGLLATFRVLQDATPIVSPTACVLLQGLSDGYCGCLTTVSTFAVEIDALVEWKAVFYALLSWGCGQLILLVILGPSFWAGNVAQLKQCSLS